MGREGIFQIHLILLDFGEIIFKNEDVLRRAGQKPLRGIVRERRVHFAGHVLRLPNGSVNDMGVSSMEI